MAGPLKIEFAMPGIPEQQGSEHIVYHGRLCPVCRTKPIAKLTHDNPRLIGWRNEVARMATVAMRRAMRPWRGPVYAEVVFVVKPPKDIPKERYGYAIVPPDLDKLERAIYDACTGIVYDDDAQIVKHLNEKRYPIGQEQPGVIIRMAALVPEAEAERPSIWPKEGR